MTRIRIILEDDNGRERKESETRVYELGNDLGRLPGIEGALERFKRQALPELTAELWAKVQAADLKEYALILWSMCTLCIGSYDSDLHGHTWDNPKSLCSLRHPPL